MDSAGLRRGRIYNVDGGRLAVHFLSNPDVDGKPVAAKLVVVPRGGQETQVTVGEGGEFMLGDDCWVLESVENVGTPDYVVHVRRQGQR